MIKPLIALLGALLLAGCATWNYPVEDAGEGVYYADSPPDYVYVDYGFSWGSMYPWIGPPYLYPMTFYSPYYYPGSLWYRQPFGMYGYWSMNHYGWHRPPPLTPYRPPTHGPAQENRGVVTPVRPRPVTGGYAADYPPQLHVKSYAPRGVEPDFTPSTRPPTRSSAMAPVRRMSASPVSRPVRSMRAAPAPRPAPRNMRRDLD